MKLDKEQKKLLENAFIQNYTNLLSAAYSVVHNRTDAEDIVQDTFAYICKRIQNKTLKILNKELSGYLFFATKCRALNHVTKKKFLIYVDEVILQEYEQVEQIRSKDCIYIDNLLFYTWKKIKDVDESKKIIKSVLKYFAYYKQDDFIFEGKKLLIKMEIDRQIQKWKSKYENK